MNAHPPPASASVITPATPTRVALLHFRRWSLVALALISFISDGALLAIDLFEGPRAQSIAERAAGARFSGAQWDGALRR
ncbi:MAG TPA: hypothetical protein VFP10_14385 [Candidatus Eisenbacteria bacterium]|nr:hypothetical protein [Candidatus Eisenbacteria bacterium]